MTKTAFGSRAPVLPLLKKLKIIVLYLKKYENKSGHSE
jgi:hypothetical protein